MKAVWASVARRRSQANETRAAQRADLVGDCQYRIHDGGALRSTLNGVAVCTQSALLAFSVLSGEQPPGQRGVEDHA
jgi:hypothetical protein